MRRADGEQQDRSRGAKAACARRQGRQPRAPARERLRHLRLLLRSSGSSSPTASCVSNARLCATARERPGCACAPPARRSARRCGTRGGVGLCSRVTSSPFPLLDPTHPWPSDVQCSTCTLGVCAVGPPCLCDRPCEVTPTYLPTKLRRNKTASPAARSESNSRDRAHAAAGLS